MVQAQCLTVPERSSRVVATFATIVGDVSSAVQSIRHPAGVHQLLIGTSAPTILKRDLTTFQDNGTSYTCSFNMGAINLAFDGQIAGVTFIALKAANTGTAPAVSYLPQELSGSFISLEAPRSLTRGSYTARPEARALCARTRITSIRTKTPRS